MSHEKPSFFISVVAGGSAGICEVMLMYPLDVVKTRSQLAHGKAQGVFQMLGHIIKTEKFGLYRGIISPILAESPKRAMKFTCNELYKPFLEDKNGKLNWWRSGIAGAAAGATETFVNCPFEVLKVRMQNAEYKARYSSTLDALVKLSKQEGVLSLYKGFQAQLIRNALWNGTYFSVINSLKIAFGKGKTKTENLWKGFISGAIAGARGTTVNTPFDVVKSRMQNQIGDDGPYKSPFSSLLKIYRDEGMRALYKGYAARIYRLAPGGGIMLVAFDFVSEFLKQKFPNL